MADDGLVTLTASEAAAEIARGAVSAETYARACLARIEALDGEIRAFAHLDREHVLAQARDARRAPYAGPPARPAARHSGRDQGHHRHRGLSDRTRFPARRRTPAAA